MFERYTEAARRVLFFSRYEASVHGALSIETEHLFLGLMRDGKGTVAGLLSRLPLDQMRDDITRRMTFQPRVPTSVEIPFSGAMKHVLQFAAEEADRLRHPHIGTEHLLLALLRDEQAMAGSVLVAHGLRLQDVRNEIAKWPKEGPPPDERRAAAEVPPESANLLGPALHRFNALDGVKHVDMIRDVLQHLSPRVALNDEARELVERIRRDLDTLRALISDARRE